MIPVTAGVGASWHSVGVSYATLRRVRRSSQVVFLLVFVLLLLRTEFRGSFQSSGAEIHLGYPVRLFFELDPLVGISNALASGALYRGLLWSLLVIIPTLFLGRVFCGWVCPMGTLNHFFGSLKSETKRGKKLIESNRYKRWQTTKYYILIATLVAALLGTGVVGWLDPFSFLTRSFGLSILPAFNYLVNASLKAAETGNSSSSVVVIVGRIAGVLHAVLGAAGAQLPATSLPAGAVHWAAVHLHTGAEFSRDPLFLPRTLSAGSVAGRAVAVVGPRSAKTRGGLRQLQPMFVALSGRRRSDRGVPWRKAECHLCLNCIGECPHQGLEFKFFPQGQTVVGPNLARRKALTSLATGVAVIPLLRSTTAFAAEKDERLVRPPGALEESDFLARCIRCGECMKVCPNNALHPALTEAGLEGIWTPVVVPRVGYCEPSCVLCSEVCPTGAIWETTPQSKGWVVDLTSDTKPIRIGTAFYDRGRCLPWAMATECIVCEEWCPTSPKAIYFQVAEAIDAKGQVKMLKQPRVDPERCVGCGACEHVCPLQDRPAVYVTSIGESRSKTNQILLNQRRKGARS